MTATTQDYFEHCIVIATHSLINSHIRHRNSHIRHRNKAFERFYTYGPDLCVYTDRGTSANEWKFVMDMDEIELDIRVMVILDNKHITDPIDSLDYSINLTMCNLKRGTWDDVATWMEWELLSEQLIIKQKEHETAKSNKY